MFTGLIEEIGEVLESDRSGDGARLTIGARLAGDLRAGDSVAVDGACLTAASVGEGRLEADVINQTLSLTTLGELEPGARVNIEPPLRAGDPLGGHIVAGHVDGVGQVVGSAADGIGRRLRIALAPELARYCVERGSITLAGVSLTISELVAGETEVALIPETLRRTTLGEANEGTRLNVELDVLARYVERLMQGFAEKGSSDG